MKKIILINAPAGCSLGKVLRSQFAIKVGENNFSYFEDFFERYPNQVKDTAFVVFLPDEQIYDAQLKSVGVNAIFLPIDSVNNTNPAEVFAKLDNKVD